FEGDKEAVFLPSFDAVSSDKKEYARSFALQYANNDSISAKTLIEKYTDTVHVVQNPPQPPLEQDELDDIYALPHISVALGMVLVILSGIIIGLPNLLKDLRSIKGERI
ncbi:MAG: hypothetical protein IJ950_08810, partial [Helicobacter sp.]|nr:hypothetical protein [Helicobacter sp.]